LKELGKKVNLTKKQYFEKEIDIPKMILQKNEIKLFYMGDYIRNMKLLLKM